VRASWAGGGAGRLGLSGRAGERKGEEERPAGLGPQGRKDRKRREREWAGPKEKKREKKNCIQIYLNLNLKYKSKWKTNNKIMQCSMKCTKPIFPYISFYS
jgi:hypothetical protein